MAQTAGTWVALEPAGIGGFTDIDTTARFPLGTRVRVKDVGTTAYGDAELIYLTGVADTVRGSPVLIGSAYLTTLLLARDKGNVAFALAATVASTYGWYQILGKGVAAAAATVVANTQAFIAASSVIDDAVVAGDAIMGVRIASTTSDSQCLVVISSYPTVADFDNI